MDIKTHRFEHALKSLIRNSVFQWNIDSIPFTLTLPFIFLGPCPWEIFSKLVKTACHHPVSGVKGFFNSIPMMTINIDV